MNRLAFVLVVSFAFGCGDGPPVIGGDGGRDDGATSDGAIDARSSDAGRDSGPPEECDEPGTTERIACGRCGELTRFCTSSGVWEAGPCEDESGVCTPGETDETACGACGVEASVCNASCEWESTGECTMEGECEPGSRQRTPDGCDPGETRELLCTDSCTFEESMGCRDDGCEDPGTVETIECGLCGSAERFCTSAMVWEYGPCESEGVCEPGTSDAVACGNCGTRTARCNTACTWVSTGSCSDEGECAPGTTRNSTVGCDPGEARIETCSDECAYVAGMCIDNPGVDVIFLIDMTGSHAMDVSSAVGTLGDLAADVLARTNARVGVAYYADFPIDPYGSTGDLPFVAGRSLTANAGAIRTELGGAPQMMGNDGPESGVEALYILAGGTAHPLAEPFTCGGGCWRAGTTRIVVMLTDAANHNGPALTGSGMFDPYEDISPAPIGWTAARAALLAADIHLIVVTEGSDAGTQTGRMLTALSQPVANHHVRGAGFTGAATHVLDRISAILD